MPYSLLQPELGGPCGSMPKSLSAAALANCTLPSRPSATTASSRLSTSARSMSARGGAEAPAESPVRCLPPAAGAGEAVADFLLGRRDVIEQAVVYPCPDRARHYLRHFAQ